MAWHIRGEYAVHSQYMGYGKTPKTISMHRLITKPEDGIEIDHINRDGLDNRKSNLRLVNHSQNMMNRAAFKGTKSGFRGVTYDARYDRWQARITASGTRYTLGNFATAQEAGRAWSDAALRLHGEYADVESLLT